MTQAQFFTAKEEKRKSLYGKSEAKEPPRKITEGESFWKLPKANNQQARSNGLPRKVTNDAGMVFASIGAAARHYNVNNSAIYDYAKTGAHGIVIHGESKDRITKPCRPVEHIPTGGRWESQMDASRDTGISQPTIYAHCVGKVSNPEWRYV